MKKYLLSAIAIIVAVGLSAYTAKRKPLSIKYVYYISGTERNCSNWAVVISGPLDPCSFIVPEPCWMRVNAGADDIVQCTEFYATFDAIDGTGTGGTDNGLISDETTSPLLDVAFSLRD